MDFVDFALPPEPSVFFFYEPCDDVLFVRVLRGGPAFLDKKIGPG